VAAEGVAVVVAPVFNTDSARSPSARSLCTRRHQPLDRGDRHTSAFTGAMPASVRFPSSATRTNRTVHARTRHVGQPHAQQIFLPDDLARLAQIAPMNNGGGGSGAGGACANATYEFARIATTIAGRVHAEKHLIIPATSRGEGAFLQRSKN